MIGMEATAARARRPAWTGVAVVVLIVAAFGWVLGIGLARDPKLLPSALLGKEAPAFVLEDIETGDSVSLAALEGRAVVINFWASWCTECRKEHPNFLAAWERYRDRGVAFVGIVFQDSASAARAYMEEMGGDWPTVADPGSQVAIKYGVYGVPETFFIDRRGVITHKTVGGLTYEELTRRIEPLVGSR